MARNRRRHEKAMRNRNGARKHPCAGKKRYDDLDVATRAAAGLVLAKSTVCQAFVYICPRGAHYHISTKPSKTWVRKVEEGTP